MFHRNAGIRAALAAWFEFVKLNAVLMRGVNEEAIWPLIQFGAEHGVPLRLIELMPLTSRGALTPANFLPAGEVIRWLRQREELVPLPDARLGHGPAEDHRLAKSRAVIGFLGARRNCHRVVTIPSHWRHLPGARSGAWRMESFARWESQSSSG
jgi:cyclic pyranopterin phosphate synthase